MTTITDAQVWVYPSADKTDPTCSALSEIADGRTINTIKPQFYNLSVAGSLNLISSSECNAYSPVNVALIKKYSQYQYVTVSCASIRSITSLYTSNTALGTFLATINSFLDTSGFTGLELDCEGYKTWSPSQYSQYQAVLTKIGNNLHSTNHKLMVDGPAIPNSTYQAYYPHFKYEDINNLPVDKIVVLCYDQDYDLGSSTPVGTFDFISGCCDWMKSKISDTSRIVIGLNSYGYTAEHGSYTPTNQSYSQMQLQPGLSTAVRDTSSGEMMWSVGTTDNDYSDQQTLDMKLNIVESAGLSNISIWSLGGNNPWPSSLLPKPSPTPVPPAPQDVLAVFANKYPLFDAYYNAVIVPSEGSKHD